MWMPEEVADATHELHSLRPMLLEIAVALLCSTLTSLLNYLRVIKLQEWGELFGAMIRELRQAELGWLASQCTSCAPRKVSSVMCPGLIWIEKPPLFLDANDSTDSASAFSSDGSTATYARPS